MRYYIGIDGGGTKTAFCMLDQQGTVLTECRYGSASYKQVGTDGVIRMLQEGLKELLECVRKIGAVSSDASYYSCFGMPNYGESDKYDKLMEKLISETFPDYHIKIVNDCEVGWAGSLLLQPGINIVAGTGSIAFGRDEGGRTASVGGWSDHFSDEGSCKWLGTKTIELFSKEADGRLEKGVLYRIVMQEFGLNSDKEVIDYYEENYQGNREKTASLQLLLKRAADEGDRVALAAYDAAGKELAEIVIALYKQLKFEKTCKVSYSGGLFKTGDLILKPLCHYLREYNVVLTAPEREPVIGAALLAGMYAGEKIEIM